MTDDKVMVAEPLKLEPHNVTERWVLMRLQQVLKSGELTRKYMNREIDSFEIAGQEWENDNKDISTGRMKGEIHWINLCIGPSAFSSLIISKRPSQDIMVCICFPVGEDEGGEGSRHPPRHRHPLAHQHALR